MNFAQDTIAAIATPPGEGGIGIVRLSGLGAVTAVWQVFESSTGRDIRVRGRVFHGNILGSDSTIIDEVLVQVMRAPHSYTREDVVEINCHGGMGPLTAVLEAVLAQGVRLAQAGEFTKRAFLNGRIDLVQAEAVIDRIRAKTRAGLRAASAAAEGRLSTTLHAMTDALRSALARIEAAVDFPDEDLPDFVNEGLKAELQGVRANMAEVLATAEAGRLYREGAIVAIAGRPNVGKSSLFNALLRDARAIVTEHAGTTRDLIEEVITISGVPVRLVDTAGLRQSEDAVEKIGVEVARKALKGADVVLFMLDSTLPIAEDDRLLAAEISSLEVPALLVMNKSDLAPEALEPQWDYSFEDTCRLSALTGDGLHELENALSRILLGDAAIAPEQGLLNRMHQRDSLRRATEALDNLLGNFEASPEFLSIDLKEALGALGEITGETTPDDVLESIFSSFCIGK